MGALKIGPAQKLHLGTVYSKHNEGYVKHYVEAMCLMLRQDGREH